MKDKTVESAPACAATPPPAPRGDVPGAVSKPSAKIILDSVSPDGYRLTTMEVKMHRFVLAEFNTHRAFSRNSASSRAIPIAKRIREVMEDPAMPLEWGANIPGMQAGEELPEGIRNCCIRQWFQARDGAVAAAHNLSIAGLHKQVANRLLEPFLWHTAIVSSTEWQNFFRQRCSPLAQPEIRVLAEAMRTALDESTPQPIAFGEWHMPYIEGREFPKDIRVSLVPDLIKIAVARCARVSYLAHDGKRDIVKDLELYEKCASADPPHWSPMEHVATPMCRNDNGNFSGWRQWRSEVEGKVGR